MRAKKLWKRALASVCTAVMAVGLIAGVGMDVKADEAVTTTVGTINTDLKGKLTIHKYDYNGTASNTGTGKGGQSSPEGAKPLAGVEFSYIKIADFEKVDTTKSTGTDSNTVNEVSVDLKYKATAGGAKIGLKANTVYSQDKIEEALANINAGKNSDITKDSLESATGYTGIITTEDGTTSGTTKGVGSVGDLDLGLYLVVETKVPQNVTSSTNPFLVSIPMTDSVTAASGDWNYDVHVYPKNQTGDPKIDKKVKDNHDTAYANDTTVSMGDTISYQITSELPKITTKSTYLSQYTFVDTLPKGLSYVKDASNNYHATITVGKAGAETNDISLTEVTDYTVAVSGQKMTIKFTDTGLGKLNPSRSEKNMVITYDVNVKSTADFVMGKNGNTNEVELTYGRTNSTKTNTISDTARVYSYGIDLTKLFSDTTEQSKAKNVEFILSRVNKDGTGDNKATVEYVTSTTTSTPYYATGVAASKENATHFKPNDNGKLYIYGLEADTYTLTEVKTAAGYSLLKDPITIEITKAADTESISNGVKSVTVGEATAKVDTKEVTMTADTRGTEATTDDSANALVPLTVTNTKSFTLPTTGGLGAILCTMLGAVAFAGAVIFLRKKA